VRTLESYIFTPTALALPLTAIVKALIDLPEADQAEAGAMPA
jgi:hypothetical protein